MHTAIRSRTGQVVLNILFLHVGFQAAVHLFGHLAQRQLAQRDQVAAAEEIPQRLLDLLSCVDVAALHAVLQRFRRQVDHHGFVGRPAAPNRARFRGRVTPVIARTVGAMLSRCCMLTVERTSIFASTPALRARLRNACGVCCRECWCAPVRPPARRAGLRARMASTIHLLEQCALVFDLPQRERFRVARRVRRCPCARAFRRCRRRYPPRGCGAGSPRSACCRSCPRRARSRETASAMPLVFLGGETSASHCSGVLGMRSGALYYGAGKLR